MPSSDAHPRGPSCDSGPETQGSQAAGCLKIGRRYQPLRTSRHFRLVFSGGKRCRVGGLSVISAPNTTDRTGIGLVAGRRVGTAVVRNRAKRRLRAALAEVGPPPGRDYVVVATRQVAEVPFRTLVEWLRAALETVMENESTT
ncbi:MAG: ribonuclease P protein component [Acidimicrobiia bacterium]|nr:ribonuclease P protein component [Acidimicrobiia bacterium]MXX01766.1 ribonuclease P protein component [Acidimicrobiia bacterium]MXY75040.1 ribonuclease P protein component [Acidimicrobiia bacterium]MYA39517.1 ribonuclease P protein component [Acidimicrobiia bacterium]MYB78995.1 ribonuclease P protein component [Acidimicrobiia bacterium]